MREQDVAISPKARHVSACHSINMFLPVSFGSRVLGFPSPDFPLVNHNHNINYLYGLETERRETKHERNSQFAQSEQGIASRLDRVLRRSFSGSSVRALGRASSAGHLRVRRSCLQPHVFAEIPPIKYACRGFPTLPSSTHFFSF